jgi:hypothetical protein
VTLISDDLGTYLGVVVDDTRATLILSNATALCESIVTPLPAGADAVVLDVAARAYGNPSNVVQQTAGPYSANYGPVGGGLWLTRANKATLRRLAGGGGAFTIDMLPATAGEGLPSWDAGVTYGYDSEPL